MAKLRLKLSQRHSKSKDKKQQQHLHGKTMAAAASRPSCSQKQKQRDQGSAAAGLPRIPYIRCGFLQGKPPKVLPGSPDSGAGRPPQSPVNKKAVDIAFPAVASGVGVGVGVGAATGVSVPVTPLPKKWLTLGCDPCKQQASLMHEDYKFRPSSVAAAAAAATAAGVIPDPKERRGKRKKHRTKLGTSASVTPVGSSPVADGEQPPASASVSPDEWQPEMRWKVVARSENKVVQRQVVLQKKSSAAPSSSSKHHQQQQGQQGQEQRQRQRQHQGSKLMSDQADALVSTTTAPAAPNSIKPGSSEVAMYKLMTTSPDQSMENDSPYAWEKDLSPFASESSIFTSFESPNKSSSIFTSFDSPSNAHSRLAVNRMCVSSRHAGGNSSSGGVGGGTGVFKLASPCHERTPSRFHWSASPPLAPGHFDDYQVSHQDPEALSKSWEKSKETCPSPDEDHHRATQSPQQQQQQQQQEKKIEHLCIQEHETRRVKHRKKRSEALTSRVMESFAVEKASVNPYSDFRESMIEMILRKDLFQYQDLEELLRTYLILNNEEFHDLIIRVFTDLWHQLYSYDSS